MRNIIYYNKILFPFERENKFDLHLHLYLISETKQNKHLYLQYKLPTHSVKTELLKFLNLPPEINMSRVQYTLY